MVGATSARRASVQVMNLNPPTLGASANQVQIESGYPRRYGAASSKRAPLSPLQTGRSTTSQNTSRRWTRLRAAGEYDDYGPDLDLKSYLDLSLDAALRSPSALVRALAVVDRRLGNRRLRALSMKREHSLVKTLHAARYVEEFLRDAGRRRLR